MSELVAHVDGGSHGNPGPSGIGVVIQRPDSRVREMLEIANLDSILEISLRSFNDLRATRERFNCRRGSMPGIGPTRTREPELPREIHSLFCGFAFLELCPGAAVHGQFTRERVGGRRDFL